MAGHRTPATTALDTAGLHYAVHPYRAPGSGAYGTANVVALLRPPARAPLVAAVYITGSDATSEARDAAHAAIGRVIATAYG